LEEGLSFGSLDPLDFRRGASTGVSLRGAIAWWQTPVAPALRWEAELIVHFPLDRLFGGDSSTHAAYEPEKPETGGSMDSKKEKRHARWGTLAATLAIGGVASAKEKGATTSTAPPASSGSASTSASAPTAASASATTSPTNGPPETLSPATL